MVVAVVVRMKILIQERMQIDEMNLEAQRCLSDTRNPGDKDEKNHHITTNIHHMLTSRLVFNVRKRLVLKVARCRGDFLALELVFREASVL